MDAINQPLLDVRDLSVAFHQPSGPSLAVDRISFEIKRGECVALVGESGSGKSVSALSILKLLPYPVASHPSGSIRFNGRDLLTLSEREIREIRGNDIGGIAVHAAARVMAQSGSDEVLVSRVVTDLVAGAGLKFAERGSFELKGLPGWWDLFAASG